MRTALTICCIINLLLSCTGDTSTVEVSEGQFSFVPPEHWIFLFENFDHEEEYRIYSASYEVKSEKSDTTLAIVSIYAQHLENESVGCSPYHRYQRTSLQKAFQKKYDLKKPEICKMIGANQVVYCADDRTLDFEFQNENVLIQCRLTITRPSQPAPEEEVRMVKEFDAFIRSFSAL